VHRGKITDMIFAAAVLAGTSQAPTFVSRSTEVHADMKRLSLHGDRRSRARRASRK